MPPSPAVLGINRTQDAGITRRKHDWGKPGDFKHSYAERLPFLGEQVDLVVGPATAPGTR